MHKINVVVVLVFLVRSLSSVASSFAGLWLASLAAARSTSTDGTLACTSKRFTLSVCREGVGQLNIWGHKFFLESGEEELKLLIRLGFANHSVVLAHLRVKQQLGEHTVSIDGLLMQLHNLFERKVNSLLQSHEILLHHDIKRLALLRRRIYSHSTHVRSDSTQYRVVGLLRLFKEFHSLDNS